MSERKNGHSAVRIASVIGRIAFVTVLMSAILAKEYLSVAGWIVVSLVIMGIACGGMTETSIGKASSS